MTESRHLVDIINQSDRVEDIDDEDKLGQPMVNLTLELDWGVIGSHLLPYFRERTFPAGDARLRGPVPVTREASCESGLEQWHSDFAIRYSHAIGDLDVGVGYFRGASREPRFFPRLREGRPVLQPHYDQIDQPSLDAQWIHDAWLWKLELIGRFGHPDSFAAAVGGFEYTLYGLIDTRADLGLLVEYLYDGRDADPGEAPPIRFDRAVFAGFRLASNNVADTTMLGGVMVDTRTAEVFVVREGAQRMGERWLLEVETRLLLNADPDGVSAAFRQDSFVVVRARFFFFFLGAGFRTPRAPSRLLHDHAPATSANDSRP